ncbi:hypothetical protein QFZ31_000793 [Neobacillus niacini]|nr:hypothetical protein [Neobacillus niacini]MDQ0970915.1 hypothetical protein [Neobacillus niacini]
MEVNQGFDMFTIIEKLFPLFFILVIGFILFIIFQGINNGTTIINNQS